MLFSHHRYFTVLAILFAVFWITLAINPVYRQDWAKNMALASLGALLTMTLIASLNAYLQRDFTREWIESLRVKHAASIDENELVRPLEKHYE